MATLQDDQFFNLLASPQQPSLAEQVGNTVNINALLGANNLPTGGTEKARYVEQSGKHKGIPGALRDVFGTLGDFLLTRLRMDPMYAPAQRQRKLRAAIEGYEDDPTAAIQRVMDVDADTGIKLQQKHQENIVRQDENQRKQDKFEWEKEQAQNKLEEEEVAKRQRIFGAGYGMLQSMQDWSSEKRERDYPKMRDFVHKALASQFGGEIPNGFELPETYDPDVINAGFLSAIDPKNILSDIRSARNRADQSRVTERGQNIASADRAASRADANTRAAIAQDRQDARQRRSIEAADRRQAASAAIKDGASSFSADDVRSWPIQKGSDGKRYYVNPETGDGVPVNSIDNADRRR